MWTRLRRGRMRRIIIVALLLTTTTFNLPAASKGYWSKIKVSAYQPLQEKYLLRYRKGKTSYGTDVYCEGVAADKRYYPQGTKIYITWEQDGVMKGKWWVVDDTLPATVGKKSLIHVRFLTERKQKEWLSKEYRVYVVIPRRRRR